MKHINFDVFACAGLVSFFIFLNYSLADFDSIELIDWLLPVCGNHFIHSDAVSGLPVIEYQTQQHDTELDIIYSLIQLSPWMFTDDMLHFLTLLHKSYDSKMNSKFLWLLGYTVFT